MKVSMGVNNNKWVSDTGCDYDAVLCNVIALAAKWLSGETDSLGEPLMMTAMTNMVKCVSPVAKIVSVAYSASDYVDHEDLCETGMTDYMLFVYDLLAFRTGEEYADRMNRIAKNRIAIEVELKRLDTIMNANRSHFMNESDMAINAKYHMASMFLDQQLQEYKKMDSVNYSWSN